MFLVRKIGSVLRGNATPFQVLLATVFGGVLGFVPGFFLPGDLGGGFLQAPGLILLLLVLVLVLNANLAVFGLTTLLAKLASFVLLPVSYTIGTWLLDGPLQGLFRALIDARVTAWFGLEYYATTGGLVLGLAFGVGAGMLLNRSLRALRAHMAGLEANSERYQKYASKRSVRVLAWLFLGKGKGKLSWQELAERKKFGLPVRPIGVLMAGVLVGSLWVFQTWFSEPVLTRVVRDSLASINGATVDLQSARIGLGDGQAKLAGLALADREDLGRDLFAADEITAQIDTGELLRKRFVVKNLVSDTARSGSPRTTPGLRIDSPTPPPEPAPPPPGEKTIEDWVAEYEVWKQRLAQAQEWLEAMRGDEPSAEPTPEQREAERERQEAAGLAKVVATHLLTSAPRFLIENVAIKGIGYSISGKADKLDLIASNLSDAPSLVDGNLTFDLKAQSGAMALNLLRPGRAANGAGLPDLGLKFALNDLPVDAVFGKLKVGGAPPLRGGTMNLALDGGFRGPAGAPLSIEAPLQVTLRDTLWALAGSTPTKVDSLLLPIGLRGPLTRPSVALDDMVLQQALLAAGQQELANFVQGQAGLLLGGTPLQGIVDPAKGLQENVDAAKARLEAEKKKAEDAAKQKVLDEAKKKLPGGLQGLIPGGGEKKE